MDVGVSCFKPFHMGSLHIHSKLGCRGLVTLVFEVKLKLGGVVRSPRVREVVGVWPESVPHSVSRGQVRSFVPVASGLPFSTSPGLSSFLPRPSHSGRECSGLG